MYQRIKRVVSIHQQQIYILMNDKLTQYLRSWMKPYKLVLDQLQKENDMQNMGPFCFKGPLDMGSGSAVIHRQEITYKIEQKKQPGDIGSLLLVVNSMLGKQRMKLLTGYQLQAYLQHWEQSLAQNKILGVEKDINADSIFMLVVTFLRALFTNSPHHLAIVIQDDDYNQIYRKFAKDAAENNAQFEDLNQMQSNPFEVEQQATKRIFGARETHSMSIEDVQENQDNNLQEIMESDEQEPGQSVDFDQVPQPIVIQVIEERQD